MEIILIIALAAGALFWFNSASAHEAAVASGRDLAQRCGVQLLDETVACNRIWLARNSRGHVQLMRTYEFEISANGADRLPCHLVLLGTQLQSWHIPPYLQPVH